MLRTTNKIEWKIYLYHYVVRANVEGLENKLKTDAKPIKKSFFSSEIVDYRWEGGHISQVLNADSELKNLLLGLGLHRLEIRPDTKLHCVWITPIFPSVSDALRFSSAGSSKHLPTGKDDFPTQKHFEAYNRIAYTIRRFIEASASNSQRDV